jgi:hypothetical protein
VDFTQLLALALSLSTDEAGEIDAFHPALSLVQTIADPSDGANYARLLVKEPRASMSAKSLLMTEGVRADGSGDSYAPPLGIEAFAVAIGLPPAQPVVHEVELARWASLDPVSIPAGGLSGNLAGGTASGALLQYDADLASDGHFVAYEVPAARGQIGGFLYNLANEPSGGVPPAD